MVPKYKYIKLPKLFNSIINRRFVKTVKGAGGMTKDELEPFLNQKVEAIILVTEGNWDTDPTLDFPVQSRGGKYVIIYKILE